MSALADGRAAIDKWAWASAYALLSAADAESPLEPEDLDRLAIAADLIGRDADSIAAWTRAHAGFLERGNRLRAAASAFWLAFGIVSDPTSHAQAAGWFARSRRLLDEANVPCVERAGTCARRHCNASKPASSRRRSPPTQRRPPSATGSLAPIWWRSRDTARVDVFSTWDAALRG